MVAGDSNRAFCSLMLRESKGRLIQLIPSWSLKGLWVWKSKNRLGPNRYYEVHIPKSDVFPNGYFWSGNAMNTSDAKTQTFIQIADRIDYNIDFKEYPIRFNK